MASCYSNLFTIVLISIITFVVLDVNKHENFNRTATSKYLKYIGAKPYVDKSIAAIGSSQIYNEYVNPYWNSMVHTIRPHVNSARVQTLKFCNQVGSYLHKYHHTLFNYIDNVAGPVVKDHWTRYSTAISKFSRQAYAKASESLLIFADWFNQNIFAVSKFDTQKIEGAFFDAVVYTQETFKGSYQWVVSKMQTLIG